MTATPFKPTGDYWQSQGFHAGHQALDMIGRDGQTAYAINAGVVWQASWNGGGWAVGGGYSVIVHHGPPARPTMRTSYCHGRGLYVHPGQPVYAGQRVIVCDNQGNSTGSHCHHTVELWTSSGWVPVDPHTVYGAHSWQNGAQAAGNRSGDSRARTTLKVTGAYVHMRAAATTSSSILTTLRAGTTMILDAVTSTGQAAFGAGSSRYWRRGKWWTGSSWLVGWIYGPLCTVA